MMRYLFLFFFSITAYGQSYYRDPIISRSVPDPTVIKSNQGIYYLYATEDIPNIPIFKSKNLVDWNYIGTAFTDHTRPSFLDNGKLWAPDINYINKKYVLYYSLSKWGELNKCGIGIAVSNTPQGPFKDLGKLFTSEEIGVKNSIDPFLFKDGRRCYLFWGSEYGIYAIEMKRNGLAVKRNSEKIKVAGNFMEGTAIEKRNGYYYIFGSVGSTLDGIKSTYHVVYGRSKNIFGPYLIKDGSLFAENNYETLVKSDEEIAGPGHQSRLVVDNNGQEWIIYHGILKKNPNKGRLAFIDKIVWIDDWPYVVGEKPSF